MLQGTSTHFEPATEVKGLLYRTETYALKRTGIVTIDCMLAGTGTARLNAGRFDPQH